MAKIIKVILLAGLLLWPALALADYHYASHSGSNTPPYESWATAADSIQKAIDAATAGDTIYVGAGVWEESEIQLYDTLALIGAGIDSTTLVTGDTTVYIRPQNNTLIKGFAMDGVRPDRYCGGLHPAYNSKNVTAYDNKYYNLDIAIIGYYTGRIENNIFENNNEAIEAVFLPCSLAVISNTFINMIESVIQGADGQWFVANNIFFNNPGYPVLIMNQRFAGDTAFISNNLFYRNYEYLEFIPNAEIIQAGSRAYVENNTIVNGFNDTTIRFWGILAAADQQRGMDLKNNITVGFKTGILGYIQDAQLRLYYNAFWNNFNDFRGYGPIDTVVGNVRVNPMFCDSNDFHLQMYSPLIDAGDPNILDVDGTRSDIGAYGGPLGQSYAYQDLPPAIPESLRVNIGDDSLLIRWHYNTESDFNRYYLYKDTIIGFEPSPFNLHAQPDTSLYVDRDFDRLHNYYYRISAIDNQSNLSGYSAELAIRFVGIDGNNNSSLPSITEIKTAYPNPFNSNITINYYLADIGYQPAEVKFYIYDIGGRLVNKLVDCRQYPGHYSVTWDGRTDGGEELSSGVYFSRLSVSGIELQKPKKITLVK